MLTGVCSAATLCTGSTCSSGNSCENTNFPLCRSSVAGVCVGCNKLKSNRCANNTAGCACGTDGSECNAGSVCTTLSDGGTGCVGIMGG
jgi:hypothetical protein